MTKSKQKGFTIIEVALVLAVAALIFLVVFLAVPALQRNQRNDAVRRDVANIVASVVAYTGNNNAIINDGVITSTDSTPAGTPADFLKYVDKTSNGVTTISVVGNGTGYTYTAPTKGNIFIVVGYRCGNAPAATPSNTNATARSAAVVGVLELSGTSNYETYCEDAN
ncbi:prepilin-type N-terminal cleavage/methylation domain-containing protein [Candidatus Saccharibacteria bacterium]|nr:prepilin-type N-terminal cleavage/methylation domain-containing protein [Candidatus Saccharibacteria bacterium]